MDSNRIKGTVNEIKGSLKEATGRMLRKPALVEEGREQKLDGQAQQAVGVAIDSLPDE